MKPSVFSRAVFCITVQFLTTVLFSGCTPPTASDASITLVTSPEGKRHVAYASFDRMIKPDTVYVSWTIADIASEDVTVDATIDSGRTWFALNTPPTISGETVQLHWVPGNDTGRFDYFGEKEMQIRLYDSESLVSSVTGVFTVIGSLPVEVTNHSEMKSSTHTFSDTITIRYDVNTDRISRIRIFFSLDSSDDWVEFSESAKLTATALPFESYSVRLIPLNYPALATDASKDILLMLKDYNSPLPTGTIHTSVRLTQTTQ